MRPIDLLIPVISAGAFAAGLSFALSGNLPMDFVISKTLFCLTAASLVAGYLFWFRDYHDRAASSSSVEVVLAIVVAVIVIGGLPSAWIWVNTKEAYALGFYKVKDNSISLGFSEAIFPNTTVTHSVQIIHSGASGIVLENGLLPTGNDWPSQYPKFGFLCTFTNYGSVPVPRLAAILQIASMEAATEGNASRPGKSLSSETQHLWILSLGTGDKNTFTFAVMNMSSDFVNIAMPDNAEVQSTGQEKYESVKFMKSLRPEIDIIPFRRN
jgi:hypothetical protein